MREFLIAVASAAVVTGVAAAAGLLAFLGAVVHPVFTDLAAILLIGSVAGGLWVWRSERRAEPAAQACAETVNLSLEAIAAYRPPTARRSVAAARWRQACARARRIREEAL
jgi:hypothetical protein